MAAPRRRAQFVNASDVPSLKVEVGDLVASALRARNGNLQTLDPLLRMLRVLGLEDVRLVAGEDLERLGNVTCALANRFHRSDLGDRKRRFALQHET